MKTLEYAAGMQRARITPTDNKITILSPQASARNAALVRNQVHYNPLSPGPIGHCEAQPRTGYTPFLPDCLCRLQKIIWADFPEGKQPPASLSTALHCSAFSLSWGMSNILPNIKQEKDPHKGNKNHCCLWNWPCLPMFLPPASLKKIAMEKPPRIWAPSILISTLSCN